MNIPPIQIATVDSSVEEEKRRPRFIISKLFALYNYIRYFRSSKPRLIFAFVPPICRAEVGSKIKVCRPYYLSGERNRARPVAQRSKSTLRVFALFSFPNSILLRFIGLLRRITVSSSCRKKIYFIHDRISSFLPPSPQKKNFCLYPERNNV